ncbi:acyl carrier protein phosphodiesterase [soil metagenome]
MNYLAHIYLSGDNQDLMVGNFIADHVKGSMIQQFKEEIKAGIILHRAIDQFTDSHPVVELSKARLRVEFRKYAPVIVDIFYDHFLARDWQQYHGKSLDLFSTQTYEILHRYDAILPERAKNMLSYMEPQNWLLGYAKMEGMQKALTGLSRRTKFISGMENAHLALEKDYALYEKEFTDFFQELRLFVAALTL